MSDEQPKEDPKSWSTFFDGMKAKLKRAEDARDTEHLRQTDAQKEDELRLSEDVVRGRESERLLQSVFWREELEPFLREQAVLKPWSPKDGYFSFARMIVEYVFGSGQVKVIERLVTTLHDWERRGVESNKILELRAERRRASRVSH